MDGRRGGGHDGWGVSFGPRGSCLAFVVPKKCAPGGARPGLGASLRGEEWFLHGKNDERDAIQLGIGEG